MTADNTKQNPTEEVELENEAELDEEKLGGIDGGTSIGPFGELTRPEMPNIPEKDKDGGSTTTGSW